MKVKTGTSKFVANHLAKCNKTEVQVQEEKAVMFIEDSLIECEAALDSLSNEVKTAELKLKRDTQALAKAKKTHEEVRFQLASNFNNYVDNRNQSEKAITIANNQVAYSKGIVDSLKVQIEKYNVIYEDLKTTV
jgi:hypothetical protein